MKPKPHLVDQKATFFSQPKLKRYPFIIVDATSVVAYLN